MVDFFQLYLKNPFRTLDESSIKFFRECTMILVVSCNLNDGKMSEIRSTFDHSSLIDLLMNDKMVMATKDEIDAFDLLCKFDVVVLHHMSKRYHHIAVLLVS